MGHICNLKPSPEDVRDLMFSNIMVQATKLPTSYSLKDYCGDIKDQQHSGFCHSFAGSSLKEIQEKMETGEKLDLSPLSLAKRVKTLDKDFSTEGACLVDVCKTLVNYGIIEEKFYPFSTYKQGSLKFPDINLGKYYSYKSQSYTKLIGKSDIKQAIFMNKPVLIGVMTDESINNAKEFIPMPTGNIYGAHAMLIVGYDDNLKYNGYKGHFLLQNSWGKEWGNNGYSWLPYDYLSCTYIEGTRKQSYFLDAWSIVDLKNDPVKGTVIEMYIGNKEVKINGRKEIWDQPAIISSSNRTLVPLRNIANALGYKVLWDAAGKKITLSTTNYNVEMYIDNPTVRVNGKDIKWDQPAIINSSTSRTLVPLRSLSELLGYEVTWDPKTKKITMYKR